MKRNPILVAVATSLLVAAVSCSKDPAQKKPTQPTAPTGAKADGAKPGNRRAAGGAAKTAPPAVGTSPVVGTWSGKISTPTGDVAGCTFRISRSSTGDFRGNISIPLFGVQSQPLTNIQITKNSVTFDATAADRNLRFAGTLENQSSVYRGHVAIHKGDTDTADRGQLEFKRVPNDGRSPPPSAWTGTCNEAGGTPTPIALVLTPLYGGGTCAFLEAKELATAPVAFRQVVYKGKTLSMSREQEPEMTLELTMDGSKALSGSIQIGERTLSATLQPDPGRFVTAPPAKPDPATKEGG